MIPCLHIYWSPGCVSSKTDYLTDGVRVRSHHNSLLFFCRGLVGPLDIHVLLRLICGLARAGPRSQLLRDAVRDGADPGGRRDRLPGAAGDRGHHEQQPDDAAHLEDRLPPGRRPLLHRRRRLRRPLQGERDSLRDSFHSIIWSWYNTLDSH